MYFMIVEIACERFGGKSTGKIELKVRIWLIIASKSRAIGYETRVEG